MSWTSASYKALMDFGCGQQPADWWATPSFFLGIGASYDIRMKKQNGIPAPKANKLTMNYQWQVQNHRKILSYDDRNNNNNFLLSASTKYKTVVIHIEGSTFNAADEYDILSGY